MGINYIIEQFRLDLVNKINNCNLPVGIAYFIVKDIYNALSIEYNNVIQQEASEQQKNLKLTVEQLENENNPTIELTEEE